MIYAIKIAAIAVALLVGTLVVFVGAWAIWSYIKFKVMERRALKDMDNLNKKSGMREVEVYVNGEYVGGSFSMPDGHYEIALRDIEYGKNHIIHICDIHNKEVNIMANDMARETMEAISKALNETVDGNIFNLDKTEQDEISSLIEKGYTNLTVEEKERLHKLSKKKQND